MVRIIVFLLCFSFIASSLGQMSDSFEDGDFTNNPTWTGSVNNFIVNTNKELQLNATSAGNSYLSTEHNLTELEDKEWRFKIRHLVSTNGNYGRTYLTAENTDLSTNPDGIFFHIGENGSDDPIRLVERSLGAEFEFLTSTLGIVAQAFNINVKIIYRANGDWELYTDLTGGEDFQLDASTNYPTTVLGQFLGMHLTYTASNSKGFYYDDIYAGSIQVDNEPPSVSSLSVLSNNSLAVIFDEPIDPTTGEEISNYTVSGGIGNPTSVQQDAINLAKFTLSFSSNFNIGEPYTLTIENVEDISGNALLSETENFKYLEAQIPVYGDIIINEFMVRASPPQGLPTVQFVELYNRSNKYFHLNGWKLSDNSTSGTIQNVWMEPGDYLILVPTSGLTDYPNATNVTSWATLNQAGDEIHLHTNNGILVDELTYTDAWYQDAVKKNGGWSIERINPDTPCSSADNWKASNAPNGGTPGTQNSIYDITPDVTLPEVTSLEVILPNKIKLAFSKQVDSLSLENATFNSTPALTLKTSDINTTYVQDITLEFNEDFAEGILYSFTFGNFTDCAGNSNEYEGTFVIPQEAENGDIVINEFMVRTSPSQGLPEVQFVELYNRSDKYFYLKDWKLSDNNSSGKIQGGWLYPGEYLLLVPTGGSLQYPNATEVASWAQLNLTGDEIHLHKNNGILVDELTYTDAWYQDAAKKNGGWSIERINPETACSSADNWKASNAPNGGTPGTQNSIYDVTPDTKKPNVLSAFAAIPNLLTITFSEEIAVSSLANLVFTSEQNITVDSIISDGKYTTSIVIVFHEDLEKGIVYHYQISNFEDCSGNIGTYTGEFVIPEDGGNGDIIINEILFNPLTGGADFVEVYNRSDKYISLKNWEFANIKDDEIANNKKINTDYVISPKDYAVITADTNFLIMNYPATVPGKFIQMALPSYTNDSSTVLLLYNDTIIDKVSYTKDWHFALLKSQKGVSLERISADNPSNSPDNWHSASETIGFATPSRKNSQSYKPEAEGTLTLSSPTFSPDGDGFEDVLLLTYEVDAPDLLGQITIYDDKGRKVKILMESHLLGAEGTVKWDGVTDQGDKAAIGPHVIIFEIFNLNNAKIKTIRKVVTIAGML